MSRTRLPSLIAPVFAVLAALHCSATISKAEFQAAGGGKKAKAKELPEPKFENSPNLYRDLSGDLVPIGAMASLGSGRLRHDWCKNVCFAPDGKTLLSWSYRDPCIRLWSVATGQEIRRIVKSFDSLAIHRVALSPDNKRIAVSCATGLTYVLDAETAKVRFRILALDGHPSRWFEVAFSPDGKTLATSDTVDAVKLWDSDTGKEIARLVPNKKVRDQTTCELAFLSAGQYVAGLGHVWEVKTGRHVWPLSGHRLWPDAEPQHWFKVAFRGDFRYFVCQDWGGLELRERLTGKVVHNFFGHGVGSLERLRSSPDGSLLATLNHSKNVDVFDLTTGKHLATIPTQTKLPPNFCLAVSPDNRTIACVTENSRIILWDAKAGKERPLTAGDNHQGIAKLALSPDGRWLAVEPKAGGPPRLWDVVARKAIVHSIAAKQAEHGFALHPNGHFLATRGPDGLHMWELPAVKHVCHIPLQQEGASSSLLAFSPDGVGVVFTDHEGTVSVLDVKTAKIVRSNKFGPLGDYGALYPHYMEFAPNGSTLAIVGGGGIVFWNWQTGKDLGKVLFRDQNSISFAPDSQTLAVGPYSSHYHDTYWHGGLTLVDVATGELRRNAIPPMRIGAYSANGRFLVGTGLYDQFQLWDVAKKALVVEFPTHHGPVFHVALAAKPNLAVTAHADGTLLLWDVNRVGAPAAKLPAKLAASQLDKLWADLASPDGTVGHTASVELAARPQQALPLIKDRLAKLSSDKFKNLPKWLSGLDDDQFKIREQATNELAKLGKLAEPALRKHLATRPSLEVLERLERLLAAIEKADGPPPPEWSQSLRAVQTLERLGTPEVRELLETLERSTPETWVNAEAREALQRLN